MISKTLRIISRSFIDFFKDDGVMLAGALSYFTMMALVPFCLFLITVFGHFLGQYPGLYQFFFTKLTSFFPSVTQGITNDLAKVISFKGIGKYSLLLYGLLSYQVFASMEKAFNAVFKVKKKRHLFFSVLVSLLSVTLIIALLTVSFGAASVIPLLDTLDPDLPVLRIGWITRFLLANVVPFVLVLFSTMLLYVLVPKTRVRLASAFKGALFTAVLLEIAKQVFAWYITTAVLFGKIYGPLTALVVFLLWLFYASCIFLIGAEIVHNAGSTKA